MRPLRITVEGFSAYRNRVDVDLQDVEFFSLSGPTGAGKSSLVDAMIFALYGRVPRLGARAVAPVITAGVDRARVALEFEVDGESYVASRVAERTETGASVKEARLERADGTPVASGAGEVTASVEDLLHLRFDDFTKTVVLPQGEFARFLNAGSKERRDLLRDLLGLELYTRMRELANVRKSVAAERLSSAQGQLGSLDVPDAETLEESRVRVERLETLASQIEDSLDRLDQVEDRLLTAREELSSTDDAIERLRSVSAPAHLEEMEGRLLTAREGEERAAEAVEAKRQEIAELDEALEGLPSKETIGSLRETRAELATLNRRIEDLDIEAAKSEVELREAELREAQESLDHATSSLTATRLRHAAHAVASTLDIGEPCPVCAREITELPDLSPPREVATVEQAVSAAGEQVARAREQLDSSRTHLTEKKTRLTEMARRKEHIEKALVDSPGPEELDRAELTRVRLTESLSHAKNDMERLETSLAEARKSLEEAHDAIRTVGRALMVARENIADLKPPHSESDDPAVQWKDLLAWRDERLEELIAERADLGQRLSALETETTGLRSSVVQALEAADVPAEPPFAVRVGRELEIARQQVERMRETIERVASLEKQIEEAAAEESVAAALSNHLKANGFERWLMAGAITGLVAGANELLSQLSGGGYSLESDDEGSFRIIDHRNADELRDVATLSGGETFLVSLALSLSLAETLSGSGGAGLDAIILDEGFGTLDEESLDVVAAVLEELAGRGLMVGVITHVKELAARAPVRYQVTRYPEGSQVEVLV